MNEIDLLTSNLEQYPNIKSLICEKDIKKWKEKLSQYAEPQSDYIEKSKFNILTTLISANHGSCRKLLRLLEDSLMIFPYLMSSVTFKRNIKSLEDYAFLSFLSELSLSKYLVEKGFTLNFNTKYNRLKKGKNVLKDIDIEACSIDNQKIYIEIYTPNMQTEISGFFDLPSFGDKFERKIKNKEFDKFDGIIPGQLNGHIILAINYAYENDFNIFLTTNSSDLYKSLRMPFVHDEIDGILFYYHNLASDETLRIDKVIIKKNSN